MVQYCGVPQCTSKWSKGNKDKLKFHSFPKDKGLAEKWRVKIRSGKRHTKSTKVCSLHFAAEDYTVTSLGEWKILKQTAIPSQNLPLRLLDARKNSIIAADKAKARQERLEKRRLHVNWDLPTLVEGCSATEVRPPPAQELASTDNANEDVEVIRDKTSSPIQDEERGATATSYQTTATQTFLTCRLDQFISIELLSDKEVQYFCGLTSERFECLYSFLVATSPIIPIQSCSSKDQFLVTLCKYKHNLDYTMLAFMFRIPARAITNICSFWTDLLYTTLKSVDFWSLGNRDEDKYRVIIDCTEIPVVKSENPSYHQLTYSQYKNRPTFKSLVGIDEAGSVIYCSDIYGGSTSDRQIVILSKFVDLLEEGTTVLADRGFEISDLLEKKNVALNIPPFLRGKSQLSEHEVMQTRKIANRRIHVERLIGLSKIHKIMRDPMPTYLWPLANKINYNCTMLCNFKPSIIKSIPIKYQKKMWNTFLEMCAK